MKDQENFNLEEDNGVDSGAQQRMIHHARTAHLLIGGSKVVSPTSTIVASYEDESEADVDIELVIEHDQVHNMARGEALNYFQDSQDKSTDDMALSDLLVQGLD